VLEKAVKYINYSHGPIKAKQRAEMGSTRCWACYKIHCTAHFGNFHCNCF